jgi:hypothetical protein
MSGADSRSQGRDVKNSATKGRFTKWEINSATSDECHKLATSGPVEVTFIAEIYRDIRVGHHGIALYNSERQLMWGTAADLSLRAGLNHFVYRFASLPLRPGPYTWLVSLFDDLNQVDMWDAVPEMTVATESYQHPEDEWCGLLNLPTQFFVESEAERGLRAGVTGDFEK